MYLELFFAIVMGGTASTAEFTGSQRSLTFFQDSVLSQSPDDASVLLAAPLQLVGPSSVDWVCRAPCSVVVGC